MRRIALIALASVSVAACSTQRELNAEAIDKPEKEGVSGAVQAPLADVNVVKTDIPEILQRAVEAPYARPSPTSCRTIANNVRELDDALGDDFDIHEIEDSSSAEQRGRVAGETMVSVMRDTATDFIPLRSWVRRLSGARARDAEVRTAVYAGRVRRAYLKGLGDALGCRYPAGPKGASVQPVKIEPEQVSSR